MISANGARRDGRSSDELRDINIHTGFVTTATGSALIEAGGTRVICTASVDEDVPRGMAGKGRGWVTAEYGMLPASTGERKRRDVTRGRPDGRTVEIQRLIGRSLRGVVDCVPLLDLDYSEDSTAEVDANVVMTGDGGLVEVQATAERTPLSRAHLDELLALAGTGIDALRSVQDEAVAAHAG